MRREPVDEWVSMSAYSAWCIVFHVIICYAESYFVFFFFFVVLYLSTECVAFLRVYIPTLN